MSDNWCAWTYLSLFVYVYFMYMYLSMLCCISNIVLSESSAMYEYRINEFALHLCKSAYFASVREITTIDVIQNDIIICNCCVDHF